jgi:hypothetical protein
MLIQTQTSRPAERKAVILLVVISLLTLFAIVALSFLLYANAEANASKLFREAEANDLALAGAGVSPEKLMNFFLKQFIYDVPDDNTGVYSAIRGHSLARNIYGLNYTGMPGSINLEGVSGITGQPYPLNATPFNGTGRLHNGPVTYGTVTLPDDYLAVNYTFYAADGFLRDPERLGFRTGLNDAAGPRQYTGGLNAPYTYPDLNNMYLAAVKADGTVLMPSFFRPYTPFGPAFTNATTPNPNWNETAAPGWQSLKYTVLRPRPGDNPGFPLPEDGGGDVKNLPASSPGTLIPGTNPPQYWNNDSFWMDLGAPVLSDKNGKKYKPLFAPLILDLDGRINLNTAGNVRLNAASANRLHASNQGWGPWEVDLSQVLNNINPAARAEWTNLFLGDQSQTYPGRYGQQGYPGSASNPQAAGDGTMPHFYGQVDYDGTDEANATNLWGISKPIQLPAATSFTSFPTYNTAPTQGGYGNNIQPTGPLAPPTPNYAVNTFEGYLHPLLYNYFQPDLNGTSTNITFPISNMEALLRYGDVNSTGATSELMRLCPASLQGTSQSPMAPPNSSSLIRNMVTTHSFDVDSPGISPWAIPPGSAATYLLPPPSVPGIYPAPQGPAAAFPSLATRTNPQATSGDFNGLDWRSISAALGKINLNRKLTPYTPTTIVQADRDRQQFAADIFIRLVAVTGAYDLFNPTPPPIPAAPAGQPQFDALRWLAQLSANIVDFIDPDDVMTTFNWTMPYVPAPPPAYVNYAFQNYPPQIQAALAQFQTAATTGGLDPTGMGWVFGTELPRVVINEAYAEFKTTPAETTPGTPPAMPYNMKVDVWAELHNPFNTDIAGADPDNGNAILFNPNAINLLTGLPTPTPVYQVVLANTSSTLLRAAGNVYGKVPTTGDAVYSTTNTATIGDGGTPCTTPFAPGTPDLPASTSPTGVAPSPTIGTPPSPGFFVVGPPAGAWSSPAFIPVQPPTYPTIQCSQNATMEYTLPMQAASSPFNVTAPTILLQRLMNPYAAPNIPGAGFNPAAAPNFYVTVDYMLGGVYTNPGPSPAGPWTVYDSTAGMATRHSYGRVQPYTGAATPTQLVAQAPAAPYTAPTGQAVNTFYSANAPVPQMSAMPSPFNWLTHLDRQLISPMELLNVSAFKPHELTQQFNAQMFATQVPIPNPPVPGTTASYYGHRAPWFDEDLIGSPTPASHFLYRLFEFLETGNRMTGMTPGGRIPGKININTFYDQEILQALCAAQGPGAPANPNYFDQAVVQNIFNALMALRSPGLAAGGDMQIHPTVNSVPPIPGLPPDQPFLSLSTGLSGMGMDLQNPAGISIMNTLMRWVPPNPPTIPNPQPLFQVTSFTPPPIPPNPPMVTPVTHPYMQDELLTKIFNNLTTRSNVFAVWLTVGFFEVTDNTTRPVKLGAEIGKAENRQIRHRMFAIVDRTSLATEINNPTAISPPPVFVNGSTYVLNPPAGPGAPPTATIGIPSGQYQTTPPLPPATPLQSLPGVYENIPWTIQAPAGAGATQVLGTNVLIDTGVNQELVNVIAINSPGPGLPPTITVSNPVKAHTGPVAITPVGTVTGYTAVGAGIKTPLPLSASATGGSFEGLSWSLNVGTVFTLDVGPAQETAVVVPTPSGQTGVWFQSTNPAGFQNQHPLPPNAAYTISYPIPVLGNPGPQPTLNVRQVPWVVRYLSIIN